MLTKIDSCLARAAGIVRTLFASTSTKSFPMNASSSRVPIVLVSLVIVVLLGTWILSIRGCNGLVPQEPAPQSQASTKTNLMTELTLEAPEEPPATVPESEFKGFYPEGRMTRHFAELQIQGRGEHDNWGFRREANFILDNRIEAQSTVVRNNGREMQVEVEFRDVLSILVASEESLELQPYVLSIAPYIGRFASPMAARIHPVVGGMALGISKGIEWINDSDPNLKATLTWIHGNLLVAGLPVGDTAGLKLQAMFDSLSDTRFRITYRSGFGPTHIEVIGDPVEELLLRRVARGSALLADYYIFKNQEAGRSPFVGERYRVRAEDVASLWVFDEYYPRGELLLERGDDRQLTHVDGQTEKRAFVKLLEGRLQLYPVSSTQSLETIQVILKSGTIELQYQGLEDGALESGNLESFLIREAKFDLGGSLRLDNRQGWQLLTGVRRVQNLQVNSVYRAAQVDPTLPPEPADASN